jgi:hypothetical protein
MELIEPGPALERLTHLIDPSGAQLRGAVKVACIGSRGLAPAEIRLCEAIGYGLLKARPADLYVGSGNALGADQAYARGANQFDPNKVVLYLPWDGYEAGAVTPENRVRLPPYPQTHIRAAEALHGGWERLGRGPRALHIRNMAFIDGALLCVAWPNATAWGGGTGTGVRRCVQLGIPVLDLRSEAARSGIGKALDIDEEVVHATLGTPRLPGL